MARFFSLDLFFSGEVGAFCGQRGEGVGSQLGGGDVDSRVLHVAVAGEGEDARGGVVG